MPRSRSNPDIVGSIQLDINDLAARLGTLRQDVSDMFDSFIDGIEPTWISVDSFSGGWGGEVSYCKIFGIVYLKGSVSGGGLGSTAFTLPDGYCPGTDRTFACVGDSGAIPPTLTPVTVRDGGNVIPESGSAAGVELANIIFPSEVA